jgi:hypothetical protein
MVHQAACGIGWPNAMARYAERNLEGPGAQYHQADLMKMESDADTGIYSGPDADGSLTGRVWQ